MGQQPHLMRLVLGRSHDEPPDWDALRHAYELVSAPEDPPLYRCVDENNDQSYGLIFDTKGRPVSVDSKKLRDTQADAVDSVTTIALAAERRVSSRFTENFDDDFDERPASTVFSEKQRQFVDDSFTAALTVGPVIVDVYLSSLIARILTQASLYELPLSQIIAQDFHNPSLLLSLSIAFAARVAISHWRRVLSGITISEVDALAHSKFAFNKWLRWTLLDTAGRTW